MAQEHLEIVKSLWEPFKGLDVTQIDWDAEPLHEFVAPKLAPGFELTWSSSWAGARHYEGEGAIFRAFKEWVEPFSEYHAEALDYIEVGDHVVVPTRQWGTGETSGAPVEILASHLWEFRDGLVARLDEFETVEEAVEEAQRRSGP